MFTQNPIIWATDRISWIFLAAGSSFGLQLPISEEILKKVYLCLHENFS